MGKPTAVMPQGGSFLLYGDELDEYDFGEDEDDEDEPTPEDEEPAQDKEE